MQFSTFILSALFVCSALVSAIPHGTTERSAISSDPDALFTHDLPMSKRTLPSGNFAEEAFHKCKKLGIDVYDEIPKDYDSTDGKSFTYKPGSKGNWWLAAQLAVSFDDRKIKRRQLTGLSLSYVDYRWLDDHNLTTVWIFGILKFT
ncbi:hypothetical protein K440DRAFT_642275 [Wilcoxina mikolae CBS 423.85]|nr:hypothetical protein K440DRAFT_642275 [Wilcoxina mikolae CBS 423.85]